MEIIMPNYYNFDPKKVGAVFVGGLTYLATFTLIDCRNTELPWAVYKVDKPDYKKGHKKYMLLCVHGGPLQKFAADGLDLGLAGHVSGRSHKAMQASRYQTALWCQGCDTVIYSLHQYDYRNCKCGDCHIDGGRHNFRAGGTGAKYKMVSLDLIKGKVVED